MTTQNHLNQQHNQPILDNGESLHPQLSASKGNLPLIESQHFLSPLLVSTHMMCDDRFVCRKMELQSFFHSRNHRGRVCDDSDLNRPTSELPLDAARENLAPESLVDESVPW